MTTTTTSSTLVGVLIILVSFIALYTFPQFTTQRRFSFPVPTEQSSKDLSKISLDTGLKILEGSKTLEKFGLKKSKPTIREILQATQRPLIVNFWATWCAPCIEEFPSIEYLSRQLNQSEGKLPFLLAVSVDDSEKDVLKFFKGLSFGPSLTVLHDVDGDVSRNFGTLKFPETYLLASDGKILHKWVGPQNWLSRDVIDQLTARSLQ